MDSNGRKSLVMGAILAVLLLGPSQGTLRIGQGTATQSLSGMRSPSG